MFEDAIIGQFPSGFTRRWQMETYPTYPTMITSVEYALDAPIGNRVIRQTNHGYIGGDFMYSHTASDNASADVEMLVLTRSSDVFSFGSPYLIARGVNAHASRRYVFAGLYAYGDQPGDLVLDSGVVVNGAVTESYLTYNGNVEYFFPNVDPTKFVWIRFRVTGVNVKVKVWSHDQDEPTAWDVEWAMTLGQVTAAGWNGFESWFGNGAPDGIYIDVNAFSIATEGAPAWRPRTNAEFTAWLDDQNAERRVLIETSVIGSGGEQYLLVGASGYPALLSTTDGMTGNVDIQVRVQFPDWTPAANRRIVERSSDGTTGINFRFYLQGTSGLLQFSFYSGGAVRDYGSTVATGFEDGSTNWIRVRRVSATGIITFFTSEDGHVWTQLGTDVNGVTGALTNFAVAQDICIGATPYGGGLGQAVGAKFYKVIVRDYDHGYDETGLDNKGWLYFHFDPARDAAVADSSFQSEYTGQTWAIASPSAIAQSAPLGTYGGRGYLMASKGTGYMPATTPDTNDNSITGDLEIRCHVRLPSLSVAAGMLSVGKWNETSDQRAWWLSISNSQISFTWTTAGSIATLMGASAMWDPAQLVGPSVYSDYLDLHVRVEFDVATAAEGWAVSFYVSLTGSDDDWLLIKRSTELVILGTTAGASIFNSSAVVSLGTLPNGAPDLNAPHRLYDFRLYNGIGGTLVSRFDGSKITPGASSYTSAETNEVWTINAPAKLRVEPTFVEKYPVYMAKGGFVSKSWDDPPNQPYYPVIESAPTFKVESSTELVGRAEVGIGALVVSNPAPDAGAAGVRDDWVRMKWNRDDFVMLLGGPDWARADFRRMLRGRLQQPIAESPDKLKFAATDLLDALSKPLQTNRFPSGSTLAVGQLKPVMFGGPGRIELTPKSVGLDLHVNDGPFSISTDAEPWPGITRVGAYLVPHLFDNGVALQHDGGPGVGQYASAAFSLNATADTVDWTSHGFAEGGRFAISTASGGLLAGFLYHIINVTANTFQLAKSAGGAAVNITSNVTTTFSYLYTNYDWDSGQGNLTLKTSPAGRVTAMSVQARGYINDSDPSVGGSDADCYPAEVIRQMVFEKYALPHEFYDPATFEAMLDDFQARTGIMFYDEQIPCLDAVHRFAVGVNMWYTVSPDGRFQIGRIGLPAATAEMSFTESEVLGMKLERVLLPVDRENMEIRYSVAQYRNGPLQLPASSGITAAARQDYDSVTGDKWREPKQPLDLHAISAETRVLKPLVSYFTNAASARAEKVRLQALYARKLGVFSFKTRLRAFQLSIGSTVQVSHSRLGWKMFTASDPQSPDNSASFDARKAVVLGKDVDLSSGSFPVTLRVLRQIPGHYPDSAVGDGQ